MLSPLWSVLQWLCAAEQLENQPKIVSDLELVFIFAADPDFRFPFQLDGSTNWQMRTLADLSQKPTAVMLLRPIQYAMQHLSSLFPEVLIQTPPKPAKEHGVYMQFRGLRLCLPDALVEQVRGSQPAGPSEETLIWLGHGPRQGTDSGRTASPRGAARDRPSYSCSIAVFLLRPRFSWCN